jgi:hypothetical protein
MADTEGEQPTMTRNQRYHLLNREERLRKLREQYNNNPDVIAKKAEKERKKAEKEAEKKAMKAAQKEAKRQQKQIELQDKIKLAAETKRKTKPKSGGGLDAVLGLDCPASV